MVDRKGNIYFTDPKGSSVKNPVGAIYRLGIDGKLTRLIGGLAFPNGLALTPDQKSLYTSKAIRRGCPLSTSGPMEAS